MAKRLNPEDLKVDTFATAPQLLSASTPNNDCTGCVSGCGIFPEPQLG